MSVMTIVTDERIRPPWPIEWFETLTISNLSGQIILQRFLPDCRIVRWRLDLRNRISNHPAHRDSALRSGLMDRYVRDAVNAARCQTLRMQIARFIEAIDFIADDLDSTGHEWKLEKLFTYEVVRIHRIRFDEKLRAFELMTYQFRTDAFPGGLRGRCFGAIDDCFDQVTTHLPRMDSGIDPLKDWRERLSLATAVVITATSVLRQLLKELKELLAAKQETTNRIHDDLARIGEEF